MADEVKTSGDKPDPADKTPQRDRRAFLKSAAQVAVTAPAVTMLLSAPSKSQAGVIDPYFEPRD